MMNRTVIAIAMAALLGLPLAALAQQPPPAKRPGQPPAATPPPKERQAEPERQVWTKEPKLLASKTLIGAKVRGAEGKDIGEITQILVDPSDGKVSHVVVGMGGVLGVGQTEIVVPWGDVQIRQDERQATVAMVNQATLDQAPRYQAAAPAPREPAASPGGAPQPRRQ
jgi:sporulation protein YlmC with PRC-barrel domain